MKPLPAKRRHKKEKATNKFNAKMLQWKKIVVIQNAKSTNAARAKTLIAEIQKLMGKSNVTIVDITDYSHQKTTQIIEQAARRFDKDTLVVIGGGDGSCSSVINTICLSDQLTVANRKATFLPLWGGNANDLATMLNGQVKAISMSKLLSTGKSIAVYPLLVTFRPPKSTKEERIALCYVSFGATAEILWRMEESSHVRDSNKFKNSLQRIPFELIDTIKTLLDVGTIHIEGDRGQLDKMYDRLFVNGSQFAKMLHTPVVLNKKEYFVTTSRKRYKQLFGNLFRSVMRSGAGHIQSKPQLFTLKDAALAQIDGEIFPVSAGTAVKVCISDSPCFVLSTKLNSGSHR